MIEKILNFIWEKFQNSDLAQNTKLKDWLFLIVPLAFASWIYQCEVMPNVVMRICGVAIIVLLGALLNKFLTHFSTMLNHRKGGVDLNRVKELLNDPDVSSIQMKTTYAASYVKNEIAQLSGRNKIEIVRMVLVYAAVVFAWVY
jgi:hypothetical protein